MILKKPFRWLGIVVVLTLMLALIPATPALAAALILSPATGKVGDTIALTASGFAASQPTAVYFSNQSATVGQQVGTQVTTYQTLFIETADAWGTIAKTFVIPAQISSMGSTAVVPGTYYLYACILTATDPSAIQASATITVLGNAAMTITPLTGQVDSTITITGTDFLASTALSVTFDGIAVTPTSGATTSAAGAVAATIAVPEAIAGVHTIVVTDGTSPKTATFTITPDIIITPQSGEAGTEVTVSGAGFAYRTETFIYFNNEKVSTTITSPKGSFEKTFEVPDIGLPAGSYQIEADDSGLNLSTAPFTLIVAAQPTPTPTTLPATIPEVAEITVDPSGDTAGSNIVIVGSGYAPASPLSVTFDDVVIESGVVKADGTFVIQFTAPAAAGGDHVIAVSDNTITKQYTYTIETTPPAIPPPLEPAMGVTVESPITFDWDAVTDLSAPVTYELQVAGDNEFTASSILFEVTALAESSYLLTEAQELKLAGRAEAYYWRIRAVDAAVNPSPWTGGGEFYISPPFSVPTWLIYTLAGVGAVIIFGIGYLVGRRTAFYY